MDSEDALFPGFDEDDFTAPLVAKQPRKEDIGLKIDDALVRSQHIQSYLAAGIASDTRFSCY